MCALQNKQGFRDFMPSDNDTFEAYCDRIGRTSAWGGQHEIIALCHVLQRNIQVFRHDMTMRCFPDLDADCCALYSGPPLRLLYGGNHYDSIVEENSGSPSLLHTQKKQRQGDQPPRSALSGSRQQESNAADAAGGKASMSVSQVEAPAGSMRRAASMTQDEWTPYIVVDKKDWPGKLPTFNDLAKYLASDAGGRWRQSHNITHAASAQELVDWYSTRVSGVPCEGFPFASPVMDSMMRAGTASTTRRLHGSTASAASATESR